MLPYLVNFAILKGHNSATTKVTRAKIVTYTPATQDPDLKQISNKSVEPKEVVHLINIFGQFLQYYMGITP